MELRPDDVLVLLVAVSAHMAVHVPVLSYPMPDLKANMTDGLSELLDDGSLGDLLDVLDTGEGKT
jgi:hypothetical protein